MSAELEHIWSRVQDRLALVIDEPTYRIWLEPLRAVELTDDRLLIEAPPHACRWIRERFGRAIQASVELVLGPDASVELVTDSILPDTRAVDRSTYTRRRASSAGTTRGGGRLQDARTAHSSIGPLGNPKLTFDQFVIGDSNRLAHAAALTVAEMPAQAYNPLFICGPPGVGKTHLLSSIASLLLSHSPGLAVRATTGEAFTNEFLNALSSQRTEGFKVRFRDVNVLLVDDVQFLERKTRTEEEFFHTFNALYDSGRQIVLTSDRPPRDLQALEDRLRERFEAGLVADVQPPDLATRMTILRKRAHHDHLDLNDDAPLQLIAERVRDNVRALEGALIRVVAFSSLTGRSLSGELTREVLDGLYPQSGPPARPVPISVGDIKAATCKHFGLTSEELLSSSRKAQVAWPRQVAMYLARELTGQSLPAIGRHFGGRDHTTVMHACQRTASRITEEESSKIAVDTLRDMLCAHEPSDHPG